MQVLIDMNLPPLWGDVLNSSGIDAVHWSTVGDADASDRTLMQWAKQREYVVFTHDLDFSALLAATQASKPSVIQLRTDNVLPKINPISLCEPSDNVSRRCRTEPFFRLIWRILAFAISRSANNWGRFYES